MNVRTKLEGAKEYTDPRKTSSAENPKGSDLRPVHLRKRTSVDGDGAHTEKLELIKKRGYWQKKSLK